MVFLGRLQFLGVAAILAVFTSAEVVMAQPGSGGRVTPLNLLGQESVQRELKLAKDQLDTIKEIDDKQRKTMRDLILKAREDMPGKSDQERRSAFERMVKKMKTRTLDFESEVMESLLPEQIKRLKQIHLQAQARRSGGPASGRLSDAVVKELGLTEDQVEKLRITAAEVTKKLNERVAKLQALAQDEILSTVLSDEQQAKYKELMGEAFEFEERSGGARGGGD